MITNFKIFENVDKETTFILDDIYEYYTDDKYISKKSYISSFIKNIFKYKTIIQFNCKNCLDYESGVTYHIYSDKIHKGKILGASSGVGNKIVLTLYLNRIKYSHEVDTSKPITIYGNIDSIYLTVINEINAKKNANKYNL